MQDLYKPWNRKWAYEIHHGYGDSYRLTILFDNHQEAKQWVKDDIANDPGL